MPIKVEEKKLYSVEDLAEILPITPLTIRAYFRKGRIKGHKIGKNWYVTKENLDAFLDGEETNNWRNIEKWNIKMLKVVKVIPSERNRRECL